MQPKPYNPGAPEAVEAGCICSPERNHHGRGELINAGANTRWHVDADCPIHGALWRTRGKYKNKTYRDR